MAISDGDRHEAYMRRVQPPVLNMESIGAMLRRRAAFIAAVTLVCAGLSLVYSLLAPPKYVATGRILLDPPASQSVGTDGAPGAVPSNVEDQINVITSKDILDKVIAREKLETDPLFGARSRGVLTALLASAGVVPAADPRATALRRLSRAVSVTHSDGSPAVDVNAVTSDRETSARVANAVMDSYVESAPRAPARTQPQADSVLEKLQARLRDAEFALQTYRQDNTTAGAASHPAVESEVAELSAQIGAAESKAAALRAALAKVQRAKDERDLTVIPETLRSGAFEALRSRYIAASRNETELSETLGSRHPRVKLAEQQTAEASRMLDQAIGVMVQSTGAELDRSRSAITRLKARLEASKSDATVSRDTSGRLKELERDVEVSRAAYQALLSQPRVPETQQRADDRGPRIEVRATPPLERSGASPVRVLLVSLILGLGLALSGAWLLELMDERKAKVSLR